MTIWIDAQLPPSIAGWIQDKFSIEAIAVRDIGLRDATDSAIFEAARRERAIVMTKDRDFLRLLDEKGAPPQIIWITCGNTSNDHLKEILAATLQNAIELIRASEHLVEISAA